MTEAVDATSEAVRARIRRLETDYADDGAGFDAKLLAALLARAERSEAVLRVEVEAHAKTGLLLWIMTAKRDESRRLLRAALPTFERELAEADSAGEKLFLVQMVQSINREIGKVA